MTRIIGDPETIKRVENAKPGDKSMYINLDAIRELPDEYEIVLTEIRFDPKNLKADFSDVGNKTWMPTPQLMYRIAEAKGIHGGEKSISEPVIEDIDINPLLMAPLTQAPTIQRRTVGRKVTKYSTVVEEDGTLRRSSPCTCLYNVWERCCEAWSKEEFYTDGYKKAGAYPNKYDTPLKRKLHFDSEMKFAHAKAETKAHEKTIRELAGLMTGYSETDLKDGRLVFAKVRRSAMALKLETAARVDAIRRGVSAPAPVEALFGAEPAAQIEAPPPSDIEFAPPEPEPVAQKSKRDEMLAVLQVYKAENRVPVDDMKAVDSMIAWLDKTPDADTNPTHAAWWSKCVKNLETIEQKIPAVGRLEHREFGE